MTVLSITDRDTWIDPTDNIVVADAKAKRLTWVPRDLWIGSLSAKINAAFRIGGHTRLIAVLNELGFSIRQSVCLQPRAIRPLIERCSVRVPVDRSMSFWYPLARDTRIEDGQKQIWFDMPDELLEGERIHQWAGARTAADDLKQDDLTRIERQKVLVRELLRAGFDFSGTDYHAVSFSYGGQWGDLAKVEADWEMATYGGDRLTVSTIADQSVLILCPSAS